MGVVAQWFYQVQGQQWGPVSPAQLRALASAGTVTRDTLVSKGADGPWVLAKKVQGLFEPSGSRPAPAAPLTEEKATSRAPTPPAEKKPPIPPPPPPPRPKEAAAGSLSSIPKRLKAAASKVLSAVASRRSRPIRRSVLTGAVAASCAAMVVLSVGIFLLRGSGKEASPSAPVTQPATNTSTSHEIGELKDEVARLRAESNKTTVKFEVASEPPRDKPSREQPVQPDQEELVRLVRASVVTLKVKGGGLKSQMQQFASRFARERPMLAVLARHPNVSETSLCVDVRPNCLRAWVFRALRLKFETTYQQSLPFDGTTTDSLVLRQENPLVLRDFRQPDYIRRVGLE